MTFIEAVVARMTCNPTSAKVIIPINRRTMFMTLVEASIVVRMTCDPVGVAKVIPSPLPIIWRRISSTSVHQVIIPINRRTMIMTLVEASIVVRMTCDSVSAAKVIPSSLSIIWRRNVDHSGDDVHDLGGSQHCCENDVQPCHSPAWYRHHLEH